MKKLLVLPILLSLLTVPISQAGEGNTVHSNRILNWDAVGFLANGVGMSAPGLVANRLGVIESNYHPFEDLFLSDTPDCSPIKFMHQVAQANGYVFIRAHGINDNSYPYDKLIMTSAYLTEDKAMEQGEIALQWYPNIDWFVVHEYSPNYGVYFGLYADAEQVGTTWSTIGEGAMILMGTCFGSVVGPLAFPHHKVLFGRSEEIDPGGVHLEHQSLFSVWLSASYPVLRDAYNHCNFHISTSLLGQDKLVFAPRFRGVSWDVVRCDRDNPHQYPNCLLVDSSGLSGYIETLGKVHSNSILFSSNDVQYVYNNTVHMTNQVYRHYVTFYNNPGSQGTATVSIIRDNIYSPNCEHIKMGMNQENPPAQYTYSENSLSLYNVENPACMVTKPLEVIDYQATWGAITYDTFYFELHCVSAEIIEVLVVDVQEGETYHVSVPAADEYVLFEVCPRGHKQLGRAKNSSRVDFPVYVVEIPEQVRVTQLREPSLHSLFAGQNLLVYTHPDLVVEYEWGVGYSLGTSLGVNVVVRGVPQNQSWQQKQAWIINDRNDFVNTHGADNLSIHLVGEATDPHWFDSQRWQGPYWSPRFSAHMNNPNYPNEYDEAKNIIPHFYFDDPDSFNVSFTTPYGAHDEPYYTLADGTQLRGARWPVRDFYEIMGYMATYEHYIFDGSFINPEQTRLDLWLGESDAWYGPPGTVVYVPIIGARIADIWPGPVRLITEALIPNPVQRNLETINRLNQGMVLVQGIANTSSPYHPAKHLFSRLDSGAFDTHHLQVIGKVPYMMMMSCNSAQTDVIEPFVNGEPVHRKLGRASMAGYGMYLGSTRGTNQRANHILAEEHTQDLLGNLHAFIPDVWRTTRNRVLSEYEGNDEIERTVNNYVMLGHPLTPLLDAARNAWVSVPPVENYANSISNHPNPFNPTTEFRFSNHIEGHVILDIITVSGRRVRRLVNEILASGIHTVRWDGTDREGRTLSSGVYFYRYVSPAGVLTGKVSLVK